MYNNHLQKITRLLSSDIGIDLGTANTLVYLSGRGIILNEPSVVAVNQKTGRVVAVGAHAKAMLGRTPAHIEAVRPLTEGVISDFEVAEEMMSYLINKALKYGRRFLGPRVVIGVPSGITNVESRAVRDAARGAGARRVYIVEEPMAAAVGVRLPVREPVGSMVVDIGGGNTDIAVLSLGGIVRSRNVRVAGNVFNTDIIGYIRNEFKILIGETTAEQAKIAIGTVRRPTEPLEVAVRGRDLITGLPREVMITDADVREAISGSIDTLIESVREVLETTPPEILADVMKRGIHMVGGGALLRGLNELFEEWLKLPVYMADSPLTAVARGTGIIIENLDEYADVLLPEDQALPPQ